MNNPLKWMASSDGEMYGELRATTRNSALVEATDAYGPDCEVVLARLTELPKKLPFDQEGLDENLDDCFYDSYLSEFLTVEQMDELWDGLNQVWSRWVEKHGVLGNSLEVSEKVRIKDGLVVE